MTDFETSDRDVNRAIRSWLHEDRHEDASRIAGAVLDQVEATPERRAGWLAWRTLIMNRFVAIGLGAAAVVVIGVFLGAQLLGSPGGGGSGAGATPTSTVAATQQPTSTPAAFVPEPFTFGDTSTAPRMTVMIPAPGWSTSPFFMKGDEVDNVPEAAILAYLEAPGTGFYVFADPCKHQSTRPDTPATTVDEIAAAFAAQASRDASEPVDVTVGGYAGKAMTLHVPDDADFSSCEGPEFATFATTNDSLARYQQGPGQIDDIYIVDVDGTTVIIDAMYRPDTPPAVVDEMRAVMESATFELP
jgi:hypothetical protein